MASFLVGKIHTNQFICVLSAQEESISKAIFNPLKIIF